MSICVLGASGFLGQGICRELDLRGIDWAGVDRSSNDKSIHKVSLDSYEHVLEIIKGFDCVINAVGSLKPRDFRVNPDAALALGMANIDVISRLVVESGVSRFVHLSSGGTVYGECKRPASESDYASPISWYGRLKWIEEMVLKDRLKTSSTLLSIARVSNPYGNEHTLSHGFVDVLVNKLKAKMPFECFFSSGAKRDFIHINDMAAQVVDLATSEHGGVFNVCSGKSTSLENLMSIVERQFPNVIKFNEIEVSQEDIVVNELSNSKFNDHFGKVVTVDVEQYLIEQLAAIKDKK